MEISNRIINLAVKKHEIHGKLIRRFYPLLIVLLCSLFLFYKHILQVYPSVITAELTKEMALNATSLGFIVASFYYSCLCMQMFVGFLMDRYSVRWLSSLAILLCAIGTIAFANSYWSLYAGASRTLIGIGVSFATITYMKLAAIWFDSKHYAFVGGLLATAAMAGAVCGQVPFAILSSYFPWRECLYYVGLAGIVFSLFFFVLVRDKPASAENAVLAEVSIKDIKNMLKVPRNWLLSLYSGFAYSPLAIFGGFWGNPFIQEAYGLKVTESSTYIVLIFIGLGIGSPIIGAFSDRISNRWNVMFFGTFAGFICLSVVIFCSPLPLWILCTLLFCFGFFLGSFMLAFTVGKEMNSAALTATVIAMINTSDALLDSITEPLIGWLLDWFSVNNISGSESVFPLSHYVYSLAILPVYMFISLVFLYWLKKEMK